MSASKPLRLAVYGTLKSTHPNHNTLGEHARVIARNIRIPGFTLYDVGNGWYPGAIRDPEGFGVEVEIVEVPASKLSRIDEYEGYTGQDNSLFMREVVQLPNGEDVLMYVFNRPVDNKPDAFYKAIPSGRWEDTSNENSEILS